MMYCEGFAMKKGIRILATTVFALMLSVSISAMTVYAEGDEQDTTPAVTPSEDVTKEESSVEAPTEEETKAEEPKEAAEVEEETVDSVVKNAIQAQVEEAIKAMTEAGDCIVTVDDGSYDGNLTINASIDSNNRLKDHKLYILADSSYEKKDDKPDTATISAGGAGGVNVNGDIYIEGIGVILGGIYYSMGNKITVVDSNTEIYGTTLDDSITVDVGKSANVTVKTGDGSDTIVVLSTTEAATGDVTATGSREITLDGGNGADVYEIDTSVGGDLKKKSDTDSTTESATKLTINGAAEDVLHLTGNLKTDDSADDSADNTANLDTTIHTSEDTGISADKTYIQNTAENEYKLNLISDNTLKTEITSKNVGTFTDEIGKGKRKVSITTDAYTIPDMKAFTNYVYSPSTMETTPVAITVDPAALGANLARSFSQLVIGGSDKKVSVGNVTTNGMNLLIVGKEIDVSGTINTGSGDVVMRATDNDEWLTINSDTISKLAPEALQSYAKSGAEQVINNAKVSVFSIKSKAAINVAETGSVTAKNVDAKALSKQSRTLIAFDNLENITGLSDNLKTELAKLKGIDFVAVKIGEAMVSIKGAITAAGNIIGRAISSIATKASNDALAKWYIPIAAGILLGEAGIYVTQSANMSAAKAIKLISDSTVKLDVAATVSALPVSIAVAAITNDSNVEIDGNVTAAQNITTEAAGSVKVQTVSHAKNKEKKDEKGSKDGAKTDDSDGADAAKTNKNNTKENSSTDTDKDKSKNLYGGFVAVTVAIQKVAAKIAEHAIVESTEGSVNVKASALESVITSAISYVPETAKKSDGTSDSNNGDKAADSETKSDKEGDSSDKRTVENTKKTSSDLVDAASSDNVTNIKGDKPDADDKKKIDELKKEITGDEESSDDAAPAPPAGSEEKKDGIDKVFDDATSSADTKKDESSTSTDKKSSNQIAGALAVNVITNKAEAYIETNNTVKAAEDVSLTSYAFTYSKVVANASQVTGATGDTESKVAIGAAIALNIVNHKNIAEIKKGTVEAKNVTVLANSGSDEMPVTVRTEAVAGYTGKAKFGIAGAVAADVASITTKALVNEAAVLKVGANGLTVEAESYEGIKTIATTNEKVAGDSTKVGVGTAISVGVNGIDTISKVGSETAKTIVNADIASMSIKAANNLVEEITATTGSAGNVGVSPAVVVDISGANAESYAYFMPATGTIDMSGDFELDAKNTAKRTVSADATTSASTGVSGTLLVTVINDSANAKGKSDIKANNIKVNATSKSILAKARARASAAGAEKKSEGSGDDKNDSDGDGDKQADEAIDGAKNLSKKVDTKNINTDKITELTNDRQKGQTSEGSISVAAAFVVNITSNESVALFEAQAINAPDMAIEVKSVNNTSTYVFADASAVGSKGTEIDRLGVGAAVAINVVNIKNNASVITR